MNVLINITFQQVTNDPNDNPRSLNFTVYQCHSFEVYSTWKNLTDLATIELPKNYYAYLNTNKKTIGFGSQYTDNNIQILPTNNYINGFPVIEGESAPTYLFMRGDKVTISMGYYYPTSLNNDGTYIYTTTMNTIFEGYISMVHVGIPVKLSCEDNFWLLKQCTAPAKNYPASIDNMGTIFNDFLNTVLPSENKTFTELGYTVERAPEGNAFFTLNIGPFQIAQNETWSSVFERLRKHNYLYFYFRGTVLRGGGVVYYPEDFYQDNSNTPVPFFFQRNIITGDADERKSPWSLNTKNKTELNYELKTDINIGAMCYSYNKVQAEVTNATGNTRTKNAPLSVLVGADKEDATEFYDFKFYALTKEELIAKGEQQLLKYYYNGFRGKFTTFGMPFVQHGNIISLTDNVMPGNNGKYLVRGVKYAFGVKLGLRQEIEIDIKTDDPTNNILTAI